MRLAIGTICLLLGALGIVAAIFFAGDLLTHLPSSHAKPQRITCANNMKQIGIAFKTWALDNRDQFPFNVGTNEGGSQEWCARDANGFDSNAVRHFQPMSNELSTPLVLVCPKDSSKNPARDFQNLGAENVSYRMRSGTNLSGSTPAETLVVCPVHGNILRCDGTVTELRKDREAAASDIVALWRSNDEFWRASWRIFTSFFASVLLVLIGSWVRHKDARRHATLDDLRRKVEAAGLYEKGSGGPDEA